MWLSPWRLGEGSRWCPAACARSAGPTRVAPTPLPLAPPRPMVGVRGRCCSSDPPAGIPSAQGNSKPMRRAAAMARRLKSGTLSKLVGRVIHNPDVHAFRMAAHCAADSRSRASLGDALWPRARTSAVKHAYWPERFVSGCWGALGKLYYIGTS